MKTLCVTGGNGLLGTKIIQISQNRYRTVSIDIHDAPNISSNNVEYIQCDITDREYICKQIRRVNPDCIIHTASMTNVDKCETEQERAWRINVNGTENVAGACRDLRCKMIHVSTDYVFDGEKGPYSEEDETNPLSFYGKTKLESEKIVKAMLDDFVIARTMVLYGFAPKVRPNFVTWLIEKLENNQRISIVTDQYGNPTLADDLARALLVLFEKDGKGIYHTAGGEWLSRYDFALKIAEVFRLDSLLIDATTSDKINQPAPRPLLSGLKVDKIKNEMQIKFLTIAEGLMVLKNQMER